MTSFAAEFLGCKVSLADAQAVRERLIGDGHVEAESPAVRVVNTCCVTAEAVAKSRKAVRRAARSAERVYVTGCAANLEGAFDGLEPNVTVVRGSFGADCRTSSPTRSAHSPARVPRHRLPALGRTCACRTAARSRAATA